MKNLFLVLAILVLTAFLAVPSKVFADNPGPQEAVIVAFDSAEERDAWLKERMPASVSETGSLQAVEISTTIMALPGCGNVPLTPDSALAGPLNKNVPVADSHTGFCESTNTVYINVGSIWPGDPSRPNQTERVYGAIDIKDAATNNLIKPFAYDFTGVPSATNAVQVSLSWLAPHDGRQYRVDMQEIVTSGGTVMPTFWESWQFTSGFYKTFLPIVSNQSQDCQYYLHVKGNIVDHSYCLAAYNFSAAELHFSLGEKVEMTWVDKNGSRLSGFPGSNIIFRMDSAYGYRDFHETTATVYADQWYPHGAMPWLGTHHEVTAQYVLGSTLYSVTIPMLWDPPE